MSVKKDMVLDPKVSADMSCRNYREELVIGNRLQLLGPSPGASKPVALCVCSIADLASSSPGKSQKLMLCQCAKSWCHHRRSR